MTMMGRSPPNHHQQVEASHKAATTALAKLPRKITNQQLEDDVQNLRINNLLTSAELAELNDELLDMETENEERANQIERNEAMIRNFETNARNIAD